LFPGMTLSPKGLTIAASLVFIMPKSSFLTAVRRCYPIGNAPLP
jgi:hypothetical protein